MKTKHNHTGTFMKGMFLFFLAFCVTIPFSTAVPNKDAIVQLTVKRGVASSASTTSTGSTLPTASGALLPSVNLQPGNGQYYVNNGDEVTVDVTMLNPSSQKIISTETWLSYDAKKLTGVKIDNTDVPFDLITPGENEFDAVKGLVRIGRGSTKGGIDATQIKIATVVFKVNSAMSSDTTQIKFYDYQSTELGHTNVNIITGGLPFNIVSSKTPDAYKFVLNGTPGAKTTTPTTPTNTNTNGTVLPPLHPSASVLPVPQNIKLSTTATSITLSWDPALQSHVAHYFVYYTKHQNTYIHRKDVTGTSVTFDNLTAGEKYYFVLTSADSSDFESAYSPETSVVVGQLSSIMTNGNLHPTAIASLNKLSKIANSGPAEDALFFALILSMMVYPSFKLVKKFAFSRGKIV